jgi:hypothetical protein
MKKTEFCTAKEDHVRGRVDCIYFKMIRLLVLTGQKDGLLWGRRMTSPPECELVG